MRSIASCLASLVMSLGCSESASPPTPPPPRFEAVRARRDDPARRFCDRTFDAGEGPLFTPPPFDGDLGDGSRWVNVWATWCAPCVEELPRVVDFGERFAREGVAMRVAFLSVDATGEAVSRFREAHPTTPASARLRDAAALPLLLQSAGADPGATIPLQVLLDATGHVRCVRSGSITDDDYTTLLGIARAWL